MEEKSELESDGICRITCSYGFTEMLRLVQNLIEQTTISIGNFFLALGEHFFLVIKITHFSLLTIYKNPKEALLSV